MNYELSFQFNLSAAEYFHGAKFFRDISEHEDENEKIESVEHPS